ncbi:MAG: subclass B3 metallo-beta-lactamase [Vicinamibacteraceae bacterium]
MRIRACLGVAAALALGVAAVAAQPPAKPSAPVNLTNADWTTPAAPFTIVGPIHYVGTKDLAAYLITTPAGHILIDGAVPSMAGEIEKSIGALGFKPQDIKILLTTQAHFDHVGTLAHFQALSKASVRIMKGDDTLVADGGASDYLFGSRAEAHFAPVKVDVVLKDGDVITLGNVSLTALRTPGHTPGCATYTMRVTDGGKTYAVVFPGSTTVNPGTRLVKNPSYPGIADDFRATFARLASLQPDIFLSAHASAFDLEGKRARMKTEGAAAFVDPAGYVRLHAQKREAFEAAVKSEGQ